MTTTLAQRVVAGLKDKILAGDLPPGHKLPSEAELIDEYGVSRTVVLTAFGAAAPEEQVEADFLFHRAIAAASRNRFYLELLDSLGPMMTMLPRTRLPDAYSLTDAGHVERVQREHDNVATVVIAGDADTARAAMRVHLGNSRRRLGIGR
jgi:DNA-binding FadR family transcriptional regulator